MIIFQLMDKKADFSRFDQSISSAFTQINIPNIRDLISRHRSHILINVHYPHSRPIVPSPSVSDRFSNFLSMKKPNNTRPDFLRQIALCSRAAELANSMGGASLVHWVCSGQFFTGTLFSHVVKEATPSLLHVYPGLFSPGVDANGQQLVGIITHGARYFIGREINILPNPISLAIMLKIIMLFMHVIVKDENYVFPDGDTFGLDDMSLSCRVRHVASGDKAGRPDIAIYQIEILYSREDGYTASRYQ